MIETDYTEGDGWKKFVRFAACGAALAFWLISIQFSKNGFGFNVPNLAWIGYVLGVGVTIIELVFNNDGKKHTLTLFIAGILAYLYGVYTNVVGFWLAQGSPPLGDDPLFALGKLLLPIGFGLFIEIVPEPLFLWGIGKDGGDVLGHIFGGVAKRPRPPFGGGAEQRDMFSDVSERPTRPLRPTYRPPH